jgi:hypothetical protein
VLNIYVICKFVPVHYVKVCGGSGGGPPALHILDLGTVLHCEW